MKHVVTVWPDDLVALYRAEHPGLVRVATGMLGRRAEAEEVVHDAIIRMQRRWGDLVNPAAYLRRSVVNGCIGVLRRRRSASALTFDPPPADTPRFLVEVRDVLMRLPERQRAALVLRYVAGHTDEEIADALGARRATVRSLVARGLATLRKEVGDGTD